MSGFFTGKLLFTTNGRRCASFLRPEPWAAGALASPSYWPWLLQTPEMCDPGEV